MMKMITEELIKDLIEKAKESPRKRINYNFHENLDEPCHRFLNVLTQGTYITPHRHIDPPKPEAFLVLRGELLFVIFDNEGEIKNKILLSAHKLPNYIDLPEGEWHTLIPLTESVVCFEVKPGPYSPLKDKDFASWFWCPHESIITKDEIESFYKKLI